MDKLFRPLRADEIEVRVNQCTPKGAVLLLYKDARCDRRVLDEVFTPFGWQNDFYTLEGVLYCRISCKDPETGNWISKSDCGTESNAEAEKGRASDAFKRAGSAWGIGRELYTKLFIFVNVETESDGKSGYRLKDKYMKFHVSKVNVDEETEKITELEIADDKGNVLYRYSKKKSETPAKSYQKREEAKQVSEPPAQVVCDCCGAVIQAIVGKDGAMRTPQEVKEQLGGLCRNCYKEKKKGETNNV